MGKSVYAYPNFPYPQNEEERIRVMNSYQILDTIQELTFDRITSLASRLFNTEIAVLSFVDKHRQWFKSVQGLNVCETDRSSAFCAHAIADDAPDVFVVTDAQRDPRFCNNPLVTGEPRIRFYAGAPMVVEGGYKLGTLCVISRIARKTFSLREKMDLMDLAAMVVDELKLRKVMLRNRAKQVSSTSHQLKTPLFCFSLCLDTLQETNLTDEQKSILDHARGNLELMHWTVENSLVSAKADYMGQNYRPTVQCVNTASILEKLMKVVKYLPKKVPVSLLIEDNVPQKIVTEANTVIHSVLNYVTNSCNFTEKGEIIIKISGTIDSKGNDRLRFQVEDTGIGVSDPSCLFHGVMFEQEYIGQGLHAVRTAMESLNGVYGYHPRQDGEAGSVFWLEVPKDKTELTGRSSRGSSQDYIPAMNIHVENAMENTLSDHEVQALVDAVEEKGPGKQPSNQTTCNLTLGPSKPFVNYKAENAPAISVQGLVEEVQTRKSARPHRHTSSGRLAKKQSSTNIHVEDAMENTISDHEVQALVDAVEGQGPGKQPSNQTRCTLTLDLSKKCVNYKAGNAPAISVQGLVEEVQKRKSERPLRHTSSGSLAKKQSSFEECDIRFSSSKKYLEPMKSARREPMKSARLEPMKSARNTQQHVKTPRNRVRSSGGAQKLKPRGLVIDDNKTIRKMLKMMLTRKGFQVDCAQDGNEGLDLLKTNGRFYLLVFCDFLMPILNGPACIQAYTKWLREEATDNLRSPFIVGISANADQSDLLSGLQAGMHMYAPKPVKAKLIDQICLAARHLDSRCMVTRGDPTLIWSSNFDDLHILIEGLHEKNTPAVMLSAFQEALSNVSELPKRSTRFIEIENDTQFQEITNLIRKLNPTDVPPLAAVLHDDALCTEASMKVQQLFPTVLRFPPTASEDELRRIIKDNEFFQEVCTPRTGSGLSPVIQRKQLSDVSHDGRL